MRNRWYQLIWQLLTRVGLFSSFLSRSIPVLHSFYNDIALVDDELDEVYPSFGALEGYAVGRTLIEALKRARAYTSEVSAFAYSLCHS